MEKKKIRVFNEECFLLGKDRNGINYYLATPSWDCGWYWGFGYVESFTNNRCPEKSRDIRTQMHFDSVFFENDNSEHLRITVLNSEDKHKLHQLMKQAYQLQKIAELCNRGGSYCRDILHDVEEEKLINEKLLPDIFSEVEKLLTPRGESVKSASDFARWCKTEKGE